MGEIEDQFKEYQDIENLLEILRSHPPGDPAQWQPGDPILPAIESLIEDRGLREETRQYLMDRDGLLVRLSRAVNPRRRISILFLLVFWRGSTEKSLTEIGF